METRFLESLLSVARDGSIGAAERSQGLTPAAVGQRVQSLEQELVVTLLERVGHRSRPTEACLRLLPHTRELVNLDKRLSEKIEIDGMAGSMRVGVISTLFQDLIPQVLRDVNLHLPALSLNFVPGTSKDLYAAFCGDDIDASLMVEPPFELPKAATIDTLLAEPLVLLAPPGITVSVDQTLHDHRLLRYDSKSWGGMIAERYLRERQIRTDPLVELDSLETIAILVRGGLGVSLVPHWRGLDRFQADISISDSLPAEYCRKLCLIFPTKYLNDPLWSRFRRIFTTCSADIAPRPAN